MKTLSLSADDLPLSQRRTEDLPGHWLLARLGKRVLRPGGKQTTRWLLDHVHIEDADVVELAPGLGRTASEIVSRSPRSYIGVDEEPKAAALVTRVVSPAGGRCIQARAQQTELADASADVIVGEAMLTMQTNRGKAAIISEAARVLRPGGRYAIHELGLEPEGIDPQLAESIRKDLARAIKVNARPLTIAEWTALLAESGFRVESTYRAPMALLELRRNLADEGLLRVLRIAWRVLRDPAARRRVLGMRRVFVTYREHMSGVGIIAVREETTEVDPRLSTRKGE